MFWRLLDLLAHWLDRLTTEELTCPTTRCPVCAKGISMEAPHDHGAFIVEVTDWPQPGVMMTIDPEWTDAADLF
jgi:hypothetical protein